MGQPVMKLQVAPFRAAPSPAIHERAVVSVALAHDSLDSGGDVARARSRVARGEARTRALRRRELLPLEPLDPLGDGRLDQQGEVAVGHGACHQHLKTLELRAQRRARGELDPIAARSERLDEMAGSRPPAGGRAREERPTDGARDAGESGRSRRARDFGKGLWQRVWARYNRDGDTRLPDIVQTMFDG
jgi:hypothetical protein